ncbi:MAG TPA: hypothetical protein VKA13_00660 [Gammaproteobacteria bacterium]|nr:hypothetical protein [Gammaproteobacteria bacterium]
MTTITATLMWILAEMNLLMLILLGAAMFIHVRNKRRDTHAVTALVRTVKESEPQQLETIRSALVSQYGQDEGSAAETAKQLIKMKKKFYKTIINIYIDKQREAFAALDQHLDDLIMSYRTQMPIVEKEAPQAPAQSTEAQQQSAALTEKTDTLSADIEDLKRQNEELKNNLNQAKQELESTITEYVSAYSGGAELGKARLENELDKIKQNQHKGILEEEHPAEAAAETAAPAPADDVPQEDVQQDDSDNVMSLSDALEEVDITGEATEAEHEETAQT